MHYIYIFIINTLNCYDAIYLLVPSVSRSLCFHHWAWFSLHLLDHLTLFIQSTPEDRLNPHNSARSFGRHCGNKHYSKLFYYSTILLNYSLKKHIFCALVNLISPCFRKTPWPLPATSSLVSSPFLFLDFHQLLDSPSTRSSPATAHSPLLPINCLDWSLAVVTFWV